MTSNTQKGHIIWADALKGFAIFLMVMGHLIAWNYDNYSNFIDPLGNPASMRVGIVWNIIYSFHMPLLFFISAYLSYKKDISSFKIVISNIFSKFQRLMLPFFVTGFLLLLVKGSYGYWFLLVLFEYYVAFYILSFINLKTNIKQNIVFEIGLMLIPFVITFFITKKFHDSLWIKYLDIDRFFNYYLFFILGIFLRKYKNIEHFFLKNHVFTFSILIYLASFLISKYKIIIISFPLSNLLINSVMVFSAIIALLNIFNLKFNNDHNIIQRSFILMGKHTLEIYLFHICFVIQIPQIGQFIEYQTNTVTVITLQLVMSIIFGSIAVFFSIITGKLISTSKILGYLILGKGKLNL